jgi:CrcB protein
MMYLAVALGSALGGAARFALGSAMQRVAGSVFPHWTLIINVTGSLLLGFLMRYFLDSATVNAHMRALLTTGFCGGYTTFSTFSYEAASLLEQGDLRRGGWYVFLSLLLCIGGALAGVALAREVVALRRG